MRSILLASVTALSLAVAVPAFADIGSTPEVLASASGHVVTQQLADGGDYIGNTYNPRTGQQLADGGDYVGSTYNPRTGQQLASNGDWVGADQA